MSTYITDLHNASSSSKIPAKYPKLHKSTKTHIKSITSIPTVIKNSHQLIDKNINNFLNQEYYLNKKVKPGIEFYKTIMEIQTRRKIQSTLPHLVINIPQTLFIYQNIPYLVYSHNGMVKIKTDIQINQFYNNITNNAYPLFLQISGNYAYTTYHVFSSNQLSNPLSPKTPNPSLTLKYTPPYHQYPNTLRYFHTPSPNAKPSIGYKAVNKKQIDRDAIIKKNKCSHEFLADFCRFGEGGVMQVCGKVLGEVEAMSQSILRYLQTANDIKIHSMVIDYILSQAHQYYFHQLKQIKSTPLNSIWDIGTSIQKNQKYLQQTNQIICKLCYCNFNKLYINKIVTNKLIVELLIHLEKRGEINIFNGVNYKIWNLSASNHVCDLCYQIVLREFQLINLERQFNLLMNVNTDDIIRIKDIYSNTNDIEKINVIKWRLLIYVQKIKNIKLDSFGEEETFVMNLKFNGLTQTFVKRYSNPNFQKNPTQSSTQLPNPQSNLQPIPPPPSLHLKTVPTACTNRESQPKSPSQSHSPISFQKIKLITFYTVTQHIQQLFAQQLIEIQLAYRDKKYRGNTLILSNFVNKESCQRYSCQVLLFNQVYQYCNVEFNVGLMYDGGVSIPVTEVLRSNHEGFFFEKFNQCCSPLPEEWIQIISEGLNYSAITSNIKVKNEQINNSRRVQSACNL